MANDTLSRSVTLRTALPENIVFNPDICGRKSYKDADIISLAHDIKQRGQDTPAKCRKGEKGETILVYGRRRQLAVEYINANLRSKGEPKTELEFVYETNMTEEEALIAAIAENSKRKDVNAMDHAFNIEKLTKRYKLSHKRIAEIYFPEATGGKALADAMRWIKERAPLVELIPEAQQAVREGEIKVTSAKHLAKLPKEQQREVLQKGTKTVAGKKRLTVDAVKPTPAKGKGEAPAPKPPATVPAPADAKAAPKVTVSVYEAAEAMARALDVFFYEDVTKPAEEAAIAAHKAYRVLVPAPKRDGKAA